MHRFEADYFDGRSSQLRLVEVTVADGRVVIRGQGVELEHAVSDVRVQPRLGRTPLRIVLPEGGLLVTQSPVVDEALEVPRARGLAHRLESNLKVVAVSLVGLVIAGYFAWHDGIPWLAQKVASAMPPEIESQIAVEGLKQLDQYIFKPSTLDTARQDKLRKVFVELAEGGQVPARLEFRNGGFIGANAFALPGGVVVMTDQLAEALPEDDQVAAVLAHEIGHLEHRHGLRRLLQDSFAGLLLAAVVGDLSAVATLAATLPTVITRTTYSRQFESEADAFSFQLLRKTGRSPRLMGQALAALEKVRERPSQSCKAPLEGEPDKDEKKDETKDETKEAKKKPSFSLGYLSTHPATAERIQAAEEAAAAK